MSVVPDRLAVKRDALAFARRCAAICRGELGELAPSVFLHGSLAFGDYRPGRSDIDLLVIVERPLDGKEFDGLARAARAEQARAPARVDLRAVTRAVAASPTEEPPMELSVTLDPRSGVIRASGI
jgi:predicted nucleotidyltransferase